MAIPLENMVGYLRTRNRPGRGSEVEIYVDSKVKMKQTTAGPVVTMPEDCCGILYGEIDSNGKPTGKLVVQYPTEGETAEPTGNTAAQPKE